MSVQVRVIAPILLLSAACGRPTPQFEQVIIDPVETSPAKPYGKAIGDLNGDGFNDLFISSAQNGGMQAYLYPQWTKIAIRDSGSWSEDCMVLDIDDDGDSDIVNGNQNGLFWYENPLSSGSHWIEHLIGSDGANIHDLVAADLNGDNRMDVAVRYEKEYERPVTLFYSETPETWQVHDHTNKTQLRGEGLATADLDGDGDNDLIIGNVWLENQGQGMKWVEHEYAENLPEQLIIAVADLDLNGNMDIIVAPQSNQTGNLSWFSAPAKETGTWHEHVLQEQVSHMHGLGIADFNSDGHPDIHTSTRHDHPTENDPVSIWYSDGKPKPSFKEQVLSHQGSHFSKIGDVDRDGDPDIFGANWGSAEGGVEILLWRNLICIIFLI